MLNGCAYILTVDVGNTFIRFGLFAEDSAAAQECPLATCEITDAVEHYGRRGAHEARAGHVRTGSRCGHAGCTRSRGRSAELRGAGARAPVEGGSFPYLHGARAHRGAGPQDRHARPLRRPGRDRPRPHRRRRGGPCRLRLSVHRNRPGTTTNIEVIDAHGTFVGGVIAPGLALGARSLSAAAARLPQVEPSAPTHVIGRNTREAMRSGVVLGEVARIDGMLDMVLAEMRSTKAAGEDSVPIVITGDDAEPLAALCRPYPDGGRRTDAAGSRRALPHQPKAPPRVKVRAPAGQTSQPSTCYNGSNYCDYGGVCHVGRSSSNFVRQAPGRH